MAAIKIENLLDQVVSQGASDLHIQFNSPPIFRIHGDLVVDNQYPDLDDETIETILYTILNDDQKKTLIKDREVNLSFEFGDVGRFRVNAFHERGHLAAALRLITNNITSLENLGMPPIALDFTNLPQGLVLVTGPTGSGKSTTLAAMIDKINNERAERIITLEAPIEYLHQSKRSIIVQREIGSDTNSFANGLKACLRQDPDIILIGELVDLETISLAITAAETGHLVLATLHTNSAAGSIDRLIDVFPADQQNQIRGQLSYSLRGVLSQRLVQASEGGRIVITEGLTINNAVANTIRENKLHQIDSIIQSGVDQGMHSLNQSLVKAIRAGIIGYDTALKTTPDREELGRLLRHGGGLEDYQAEVHQPDNQVK